MIPYGKHTIHEDDIDAVVDVLRHGWLTQGEKIEQFEAALSTYCGAAHAVVVSNGTAALHAAFVAAGLQPGDEFITSAMSFVATGNAGLWQGAVPVFVDIDEKTGNIDATLIAGAITKKTKAIVPIDYTGYPASLDEIRRIAQDHRLIVIEDAAQALGASYKGQKIGSLSDLTTFSFHPVKSITTGEGGAIVTNNERYYQRMKSFITHGITKQNLRYPAPGQWYMEQQMLGQNYRLTDIQAALGMSQLKRLDAYMHTRRALAKHYTEKLRSFDSLILPEKEAEDIESAWHLYVVRLAPNMTEKKSEIFAALQKAGIGVQVHHIPIHLHPYYQERFGTHRGMLPKTESWYDAVFSLPLYPGLTLKEQDYVIDTLGSILSSYV